MRHPLHLRATPIVLAGWVCLALPVTPFLAAQPGVSATPATEPLVRTPEHVTVNRQPVPGATSIAAPAPGFSTPPTEQEIFRARVFAEPFVPVGKAPAPNETAALAAAIIRYRADRTQNLAPFSEFVARHPDSAWAPSVQLNLGLRWFEVGRFSRAIAAYEAAWAQSKTVTEARGKLVADRAVAELLQMNARLGRQETLQRLFAEIDGRVFSGRSTELVAGARDGFGLMQNRPEDAFRCGPAALDRILAREQHKVGFEPKLMTSRSTRQGICLTDVEKLSKDVGLKLQIAKRQPGAAILSPAVVHWKLGHYAALFAEGGAYRLEDPTFGTNTFATAQTIDDEASGYFLVPAGPLPAGWTAVADEEGRTVWGKGSTEANDLTRTTTCDLKIAPCCSAIGMAVANAHMMVVSLNLTDTPVGYTPPRGPAVNFTATYNQREASQPSVPDFSNLGSKWVHSWLSFIDETVTEIDHPPVVLESQYLNPNPPPIYLTTTYIYTPPPTYVLSPTVRLLGGGSEVYPASPELASPDATYTFQQQTYSNVELAKTDPATYETRSPDGSKLVYGYRVGRRYFLTQMIDATGQTLALAYDGQNRLASVTDALGQVTTFAYEFAADPFKITKVTDPFGRFARFDYDSDGRLQKITDVIGLTSTFTYQGSGDFISALTTPYGTSTFAFDGGAATSRDRWLELTDPQGAKQRVECRDEWLGLPDAGPLPAGMSATVDYQDHRNTLYWDKKAMIERPGDVNAAHIYHWLHATLNLTSGTLESEKAAYENRVWYNYEGQTYSYFAGLSSNRTAVGRVLDDGTTQLSRFQYNSSGHVTQAIDPLGRQTSFAYDPNGIDLLEIDQKTGPNPGDFEVLGKFTFNSQHLPLTAIDAAGGQTTLTYNSAGQPLTITNAKGEITTLGYNADGYLTTVDGPLPGPADTTTLTYDGYGRLRTVTDSEGYTVTTDYDAFDRPTVVTYPDGTFEQIVYDKLDQVKTKDRRDRWTQMHYNAVRQLIAAQDPLDRLTQLAWCKCGSLRLLTDALGQNTTWDYDVQGRVTRKHYADNTAVAYTYENTTSRLKSVTDPKGQVTNYQYFMDNALKQVSYTNATVATPTVSFTYDPFYPRIATMTDGLGTTTYAYNPVPLTPTPGAGRLASIDGPLANDTITYTYDELGRTLGRAINGNANASSVVYDALGRVTSAVNPLGMFTYGYVNATSRLDHVIYPNAQRTNYGYFNNAGDQRLQQIQNLKPDASNLSTFGYTYDAEGVIQGWSKQINNLAAQTSGFKYDLADQLTEASVPSVSSVTKNFVYRYDKMGNRTSEQIDSAVTAATHNTLNQVTALSPSGPVRFEGSVSEPANVTINGASASVDATNKFTADVTLAPGTQAVAVAAADGSGNTATKNYQVTVAGGAARSLTYDPNGNLTNDGAGKTYAWDAANRLVKITQTGGVTDFVYDGLGRRVQEKLNGTVIKQWVWCDGAQPCEERDASNAVTKRFYAQGEQINGIVYFFATDHLGSVREMTDSSGAIRARYDYDSFGRTVKISGDLEADFGFTGFYRHQSSGLSLTLYRAYDAGLGRWLSRDPIGENGGVNLYGYVGGNPTGLIDPLGLVESPGWMRATIPGQIAWDSSRTAFANGQYGWAIAYTGQMLVEQAVTLFTLGEGPAISQGGRTAAAACKISIAKTVAKDASSELQALLQEQTNLERALWEVRQQLDNGRAYAAWLKDRGMSINPYGLGREINELFPAQIAKMEARLSEIRQAVGLIKK